MIVIYLFYVWLLNHRAYTQDVILGNSRTALLTTAERIGLVEDQCPAHIATCQTDKCPANADCVEKWNSFECRCREGSYL